MAALPSPNQVAGTHCAIYEAYYHQVDPNGSGAIQALDAARFLKKSRLSDVVLSKIWDLSDPTGKGYLDKPGLFVALKLVALAQAGKDINMSNIHSEAPPPKVGEMPKVPPVGAAPPARPVAPSPVPHAPHAAPSDWTMKPHERDKYSQLFDSLQPSNGLIAGNKVKGVLMESKLPLDTLGKIWDLADQDKDGMLDRHEFMVAMHLVYKALEKHAIPTILPVELSKGGGRPARPPSRPPSRPASRPPSRPASPSPSPQPRGPPPRPQPPATTHPQSNADLLEGLLDLSSPPAQAHAMCASPLMSAYGASGGSGGSVVGGGGGSGGSWVVSPAEQAQFEAQFDLADTDRDGYVSGLEIKHVFLDSGLPQQTLAHIWALCDMEGVGKLSRGQFCLAMWLVGRARRGLPPPPALTHDMLPPTALTPTPTPAPAPAPAQKVEIAPSLGPQPTAEMEAIAREIEALAGERLALEAELAARRRDLAASTSEADGLQSELDTLTATLKQLENQKGEAQKRLNDLKSQVEKLRAQVSAQEAAAAETEAEVAARRAANNTLRERERALQGEAREREAEAEELTRALSRTVLAISQANIKIAHLEEQQRSIEEAAEALAAAAPAQAHLQLQPLFSADHLDRLVRGITPSDALEDESFPNSNGFGSRVGGDTFASDPFKENSFSRDAALPLPQDDPFAPAASAATHKSQDGFGADPFASNADPFAGDAFAQKDNNNTSNNNGAWDSDPFAVLHAPTRASRGSAGPTGATGAAGVPSPSPALPPKQTRTPPPRPAPPRPNPPLKSDRAAMDFTDDPFKDYRYEDPFNIEDPFASTTATVAAGRPTSVVGFETDDFFGASSGININGGLKLPEKRSGRVSAPPVAYDPFSGRSESRAVASNNNDSWADWPNDNWAADGAWSKSEQKSDAWAASTKNTNTSSNVWKTDNWANKSDNWSSKGDNLGSKSDNWANKSDNWTADWGAADRNRNANETWPSNTLPSKKEKSPKPVKYAKSLVHTIGGIGRSRQKEKKAARALEARSTEALPSEEKQWAWAAAESARLGAEAEERRRREDAELQLALAISRQEK